MPCKWINLMRVVEATRSYVVHPSSAEQIRLYICNAGRRGSQQGLAREQVGSADHKMTS